MLLHYSRIMIMSWDYHTNNAGAYITSLTPTKPNQQGNFDNFHLKFM
jgi:hypothetical protein